MIRIAGEVGPVLGLPEQVSRDQLGVGVLVGDHEDLGRSGQQVDPDATEQLALGLGHVRVARADDHVDGGQPLDTERHRRQRLDAAEAEDLVGAAGRHRMKHRRVHPATLARRRDGDDPLHPATLGTTIVMNADASIG